MSGLIARFGGRTHLLLIVLAALVPPCIFAGAGYIAWQGQLAAGQARLSRALDVAHENASRVLETYQLLLVEATSAVANLSDAEMVARESNLQSHWSNLLDGLPQVQDLYILDRNGYLLVSARLPPTNRAIDLSANEDFKSLQLNHDTVAISKLQPGSRGAGSYFTIAVPRRAPDGTFLGIIAIAANPTYFEDFWLRNTIADNTPEGVTIAMFRGGGDFLVRWPQPVSAGTTAHASADFLTRIAEHAESATYRRRSLTDGIDRILAYRQVESLQIYLAAAIRISAIQAQWRATMLTHLYFGLPATLALITLAIVAARHLRREQLALALLREEARKREASEAALRQSQKMEAVGRLTGGIAHDFNNLLTVIGGSIEMLARSANTHAEQAHRYAKLGRDAVQRAATLTHRLLAFARKQPLDPHTLDLNNLVAGMSELLRRSLGADIEIETVLAGGLWRTRTDPGQLENALLNLAVNARDAMPEGGRLTIETANTHLDTAYAAANPEVEPGQYVMLAVTDTGTGMSPEIAAQAFEPFFTTKPVGKGTGLGLSMIYGFAKQSDGHLKIYSEVGHGTTVKLYLPRVTADVDWTAQQPAEPAAAHDGTGETILVVEDDDAVRQFSIDALHELGYRVLWASDAASALNLIQSNPEIALVFIDVVLPGGMDGRRLAESALRLRPGLPVLFATGYTANAVIHSGMLDAGVHLVTKPFTAATLGSKLRAVMDAAKATRAFPDASRLPT